MKMVVLLSLILPLAAMAEESTWSVSEAAETATWPNGLNHCSGGWEFQKHGECRDESHGTELVTDKDLCGIQDQETHGEVCGLCDTKVEYTGRLSKQKPSKALVATGYPWHEKSQAEKNRWEETMKGYCQDVANKYKRDFYPRKQGVTWKYDGEISYHEYRKSEGLKGRVKFRDIYCPIVFEVRAPVVSYLGRCDEEGYQYCDVEVAKTCKVGKLQQSPACAPSKSKNKSASNVWDFEALAVESDTDDLVFYDEINPETIKCATCEGLAIQQKEDDVDEVKLAQAKIDCLSQASKWNNISRQEASAVHRMVEALYEVLLIDDQFASELPKSDFEALKEAR